MIMSEKNYKLPVVTWLKVTDYMHGWLQKELGGSVRTGGKLVICLQIPDREREIRDVFRMETSDDMAAAGRAGGCENTLSATRRNCIVAGMELDETTVERMYGITREELDLYVPIECPKVCLTRDGVLRPWTNDTCFGQRQATAMQRLLREAFWQGVADYNNEYARKLGGEKYAAIDMIEAFCADTGTSELCAQAMRREWQRRVKRSATKGGA